MIVAIRWCWVYQPLTPNVSGENPKKLKTRKQPDGVADVLREIQVGLRPG